MRLMLQTTMVLFFASLLWSLDVQAAKPVGIALKTKGSVYLEKENSKAKAITKGFKIYSGDTVVVSAESELTLLDLEVKRRITLPEGSYPVESGDEAAESSSSVVLSRMEELLNLQQSKTAVGGTRDAGECRGDQFDAINFFQTDEPQEWMIELVCKVRDCVSANVVLNNDTVSLRSNGGVDLPMHSRYQTLPEIDFPQNAGRWVVYRDGRCDSLPSSGLHYETLDGNLNVLVWSTAKNPVVYSILMLDEQEKQEIRDEVEGYRSIWEDESNPDRLWALYELYSENGLFYDAFKILESIKLLSK